MILNIKRFAPDSYWFEVDVRKEYEYTTKNYTASCTVILMGEHDFSSIVDQNDRDVTSEWNIHGNMGSKRITQETHDVLTIHSEDGYYSDNIAIDVSDFTPDSDLYAPEINGDVRVRNSNIKMKNVADVVENYFNELYPVGSIYKTTSNTIPFSKGTWTKISEKPDRECIGSQVIWGGTSGSALVSKTNVLGAYGTRLYSGIFDNITIPTGYHKEYKLSFQGTTGGDTQIILYLNNIATEQVGTWSGNTFRVLGTSNFFKESDITLETAFNYSQQGTNLKYAVTNVASSWQFWNVTIHGFLTSNDTWYTWKRIG